MSRNINFFEQKFLSLLLLTIGSKFCKAVS
jgi:hypothetical protein